MMLAAPALRSVTTCSPPIGILDGSQAVWQGSAACAAHTSVCFAALCWINGHMCECSLTMAAQQTAVTRSSQALHNTNVGNAGCQRTSCPHSSMFVQLHLNQQGCYQLTHDITLQTWCQQLSTCLSSRQLQFPLSCLVATTHNNLCHYTIIAMVKLPLF